MKNIENLIEQIVNFLPKKNSSSGFDEENLINFIKAFYVENLDCDFVGYTAKDLYEAAILSFNFFRDKKPGQLKIRIYNPSQKEDGFESPYTFLDIINDDMPFLVDSTIAYLDKYGIRIKNIIHPICSVFRDQNGRLQKISADNGSRTESIIQLHLDKIISESDIKMLEENIGRILQTVTLVVNDWNPMLELARKAQDQLSNAKILKSDNEIIEIKEFISWIISESFIFLGAKEFDIKANSKGEYQLHEVENSGFGIFRSPYEELKPEVLNCSFEEVGDSVANPFVIEILKSRYRSRIHRIANAERIRVQKISADGKVFGEFRFIGLFSSSVYNQNPTRIPLVRDKIAQVVAESGYFKGSHSYKNLISTLESYPRDELFQISAEDLLKNATGIVSICGRSQVKFFARKDKFNRFVSCLVFTPRDRSSSDLRSKIKNYLSEIYCGEVADSFVQITDSNLIRFHLIVRTNNGIPQIDEFMVEQEITKMTRVWSDDLREAISFKFGDERRLSLFAKYKNSFSISYINRFDPKRGAIDISRIEECLRVNSALFNLYKSSDSLPEDITELKIYNPDQKIILSAIMPVLESFGFNVIQEHTYTINIESDEKIRSHKKVWIHYFLLNLGKAGDRFSEKVKLNFEKTISLIWCGITKVGFLNRLVIAADLNWKQVYMLRGYAQYLYQIGIRHGSSFIADIMVRYSDLTKDLVRLFETKFNPFLKISFEERSEQIELISERIRESLNNVRDIADDMVIRKFFTAISATTRTNYYQISTDGGFKGYLSFKLDSQKIPDLPLPVPFAEIFVYSPKVEAIHLRGGKVARGGLRWSDRQEDFRTEILGLMKAQMTKNAVIVPVGSKGGFVIKRDILSLSRDEIQKEAIECYQIFLRGLLDITDNVINGEIKHPQNLVRHDESDPYLVVAADKGTASFSDIANAISAEYNFWLGDAFASGGSVGYDHKKMGITAKGAWVSVMRHFREMGIDTQSQDFTCVGIGDLAGDVFGNGMILSRHTKLVAAFNHVHIFLDPNPDPALSFQERQRIFNLPRSSWLDYDKSLISAGGGVFERSAKIIKISSEVKSVLQIEEDELSPTDLICAILESPVDLLWNGGIGTYVKSTDESNLDVGDRGNDLLRINGNQLRCKVVGEGGNLGFTQKGRIEYALTGGRINTDAMDNSAGVDCSDHEVNIKIALINALRSKKISLEKRNKILELMTDEVSQLVLNDNHLQTQAISIAYQQGVIALDDQEQFLNQLEKSGLLNRKMEFLPSQKEIAKRRLEKIGMTRPELCVMLAYSKMDIYSNLLNSNLVKDPYFEKDLLAYFPKAMQKDFSDEILSHQLRKEIIATQITNFVVNRSGINFVRQICQDSGFEVVDVVRSFIITCDSFRLREIWEELEKLDGKIPANIQMQMFISANKLLKRSVLWLLRNQIRGEVEPVITRFRKIADELSAVLPTVLARASIDSYNRKIERYRLNGVEREIAEKIAALDPVASAFDIAEISSSSDFDLLTIAKIYFAVGARFSLKWLRSKVSNLILNSYWQNLSSKTILEDLYSYQMQIANRIVEFSCRDQKLCEVNSFDNWIKTVHFLVERFDSFILDLKNNPNPDLSVFIVALNRLKPLAGN